MTSETRIKVPAGFWVGLRQLGNCRSRRSAKSRTPVNYY